MDSICILFEINENIRYKLSCRIIAYKKTEHSARPIWTKLRLNLTAGQPSLIQSRLKSLAGVLIYHKDRPKMFTGLLSFILLLAQGLKAN